MHFTFSKIQNNVLSTRKLVYYPIKPGQSLFMAILFQSCFGPPSVIRLGTLESGTQRGLVFGWVGFLFGLHKGSSGLHCPESITLAWVLMWLKRHFWVPTGSSPVLERNTLLQSIELTAMCAWLLCVFVVFMSFSDLQTCPQAPKSRRSLHWQQPMKGVGKCAIWWHQDTQGWHFLH